MWGQILGIWALFKMIAWSQSLLGGKPLNSQKASSKLANIFFITGKLLFPLILQLIDHNVARSLCPAKGRIPSQHLLPLSPHLMAKILKLAPMLSKHANQCIPKITSIPHFTFKFTCLQIPWFLTLAPFLTLKTYLGVSSILRHNSSTRCLDIKD